MFDVHVTVSPGKGGILWAVAIVVIVTIIGITRLAPLILSKMEDVHRRALEEARRTQQVPAPAIPTYPTVPAPSPVANNSPWSPSHIIGRTDDGLAIYSRGTPLGDGYHPCQKIVNGVIVSGTCFHVPEAGTVSNGLWGNGN